MEMTRDRTTNKGHEIRTEGRMHRAEEKHRKTSPMNKKMQMKMHCAFGGMHTEPNDGAAAVGFWLLFFDFPLPP